MQFVNIVVHSVESMNFRVHLQYEFTNIGLDDYLEVSMPIILRAITAFTLCHSGSYFLVQCRIMMGVSWSSLKIIIFQNVTKFNHIQLFSKHHYFKQILFTKISVTNRCLINSQCFILWCEWDRIFIFAHLVCFASTIFPIGRSCNHVISSADSKITGLTALTKSGEFESWLG